MRVWVFLLSLVALAGCGAAESPGPFAAPTRGAVRIATRPTPLTWRPLDSAGTTACAVAREAVLGDAGFNAAVVAAIVEASQRSTRPGVRWHGELLKRTAGSVRGSSGDPAAARRNNTDLELGIKNYYEQCAYGTWSTPDPDPED